MIFVDASAILAILSQEGDALRLAELLDDDRDRLCSAVVIWETVAGLCRSYEFPVQGARLLVRDFLDEFRFRVVGIGARESEIATDAFARYGRGRHPAALNMGDCSAYACAKSNGAKLLYVGSDFEQTDLA